MRNVTCSTRAEFLEVHRKSWDIWIWSNAPTFICIQGPLFQDFKRYCETADPDNEIGLADVVSLGMKLATGDGLGYFAEVITKQIKFIRSIRPWKRRFGDDDLYAAFSWLTYIYRVARESSSEVVFVWDSPQ